MNLFPDQIAAWADCGVVAVSFLTVLFLTGSVRKILIKRDLLDRPNQRSSHKEPVPRGGGWAVVMVVLPGIAFYSWANGELAHYAGFLAGSLILILISWLDDRHGMSARLRLALHIAAACLGSLILPQGATLFHGVLPYAADRLILIMGWAWFMNLYNFMDGIDGITGVETVSIATGTCLCMSAAAMHMPMIDGVTLLLTGACLGFLAHNWHPARIFLGDVGSIPLGYWCGLCLLTIALSGHLVPALILPLYYLADSGITILKRAMRGEKVWQAHREHYYQRAALGTGRHDRVVGEIMVANIVLILLALLAFPYPLMGGALAVLTVAMLLRKMHKQAHAEPQA